jgi:hypothetical protein
MDAEPGLVETDPIDADRIIGAGGEDQFTSDFLGAGRLREIGGIERVVRVGCKGDEVQFTGGDPLQVLGD